MSIDPYAAQPSAAVPLDKPLYGASFGQAVSRFFKKYGTFSGRASRSEFWWVQLFTTLVAIVLTIVIIAGAVATSGPDVSEPGTGIIPGLILLIIFALAIIVPGIAVTVRRLHDANFSGWFYLLTLTSVGGIIVLVFTLLEPKPEGARFDADFNGQFPGQPGVYPMQPANTRARSTRVRRPRMAPRATTRAPRTRRPPTRMEPRARPRRRRTPTEPPARIPTSRAPNR